MLFKENKLSWFSKGFIYIILFLTFISAGINIFQGVSINPEAFVTVLLGLILFLVAKILVVKSGPLISFGTKPMTCKVANIYRLGYWLMAVGILLTFAGKI